MEGIIKKLNEKGFGFITPEGETKDVFFHRNDLVDADFNDLREGDKVAFEVEAAEKGPKAVNVTVV
ncbi:cold shock domain-containing protein [Patescibacteria group bacterium]|nr:cold shock domain-containing protein [Patescibacteria group bacterium]MBU1682610.1 cold shock domain-containing protein [Patescibacteria group bacterium]